MESLNHKRVIFYLAIVFIAFFPYSIFAHDAHDVVENWWNDFNTHKEEIKEEKSVTNNFNLIISI